MGLSACSTLPSPPHVPESYLTSARFRRAALAASIVDPDNDYSRLRLREYANHWDELPERNPAVTRVGVNEVAAPLTISPAARRGDTEALRALGEEAFFRYPVQSVPALRAALAAPAHYGLWTDPHRGVGGVVRIESSVAVTCATCHARAMESGELVVGAGNERLDLGRIYVDAGALAQDPARAEHVRAWGPGRMDVTTLRGDEPMRIPDLRPVRFLTDLHQDATLALRDVTTLAIRIETLVIVSSGATQRPPREVALGLATYLWSLGATLPVRAITASGEARGREIFSDRCSRCHVPPSFSGPRVALQEIGTDPVVGRSRDRGTGCYRVPSLRGVSTRGPLLHDASLPSLDTMFDPERRVPGHRYGLDLDDRARRDLLDYVRSL